MKQNQPRINEESEPDMNEYTDVGGPPTALKRIMISSREGSGAASVFRPFVTNMECSYEARLGADEGWGTLSYCRF